MSKSKIKISLFTLAMFAVASFGMTSCDKGTRPGETNVERSDIRDEGELIGEEGGQNTRYDAEGGDTLEKYYDHADHEYHGDNDGEALGDGAYDGKGEGITRDKVQD